jgi:curved DNA-binding protein CbpA
MKQSTSAFVSNMDGACYECLLLEEDEQVAKRDYYRLLKVCPHDDRRAIDEAYWDLAHVYHERLRDSPTAARRLQILNEAYETLGIPDRRRAYNRELAEGNAPGGKGRGGFFGLVARLFSRA